jgi:phage-related protein
MKPVVFLGDSLDRVRAFPEDVRRNAGYQIERVQRGLDPDDWKPMTTIGARREGNPGETHERSLSCHLCRKLR